MGNVPSFAKAMEASRDFGFLCTNVDFWGLLVGYQWFAHVDLNPHLSTFWGGEGEGEGLGWLVFLP